MRSVLFDIADCEFDLYLFVLCLLYCCDYSEYYLFDVCYLLIAVCCLISADC